MCGRGCQAFNNDNVRHGAGHLNNDNIWQGIRVFKQGQIWKSKVELVQSNYCKIWTKYIYIYLEKIDNFDKWDWKIGQYKLLILL